MTTEVVYKPDQGGSTGASVELKSPAKNRRTDQTMSNDGQVQNGAYAPPVRRNSRIPVLFHRVTSSFYNPQFDSKTLEKQHNQNYFNKTRQRYQYALLYIIVACVVWIAYFSLMQLPFWLYFVLATCGLLVLLVGLLLCTFSKWYPKYWLLASIITPLLTAGVCLLSFIHIEAAHVSQVGLFSCVIAVLLLIYTLLSLPLYICVFLGAGFSTAFELLWVLTHGGAFDVKILATRIILHICIHMVGVQNFLMSQARKRSTFLKVGQSIVSKNQLDEERTNKMRMIQSLMPRKVAEEVMKKREVKEDDQEEQRAAGATDDTQIKFRDFHMSQMDNVSIVFADIVGFTKMSSNKTAEHLVSLLNDLFGRFDVLCTQSGCEKISTLGDCYYCVSGCPEPRADHAQCCIEMGLGMVQAIEEFDRDHNEEVGMRVGVHTGTVLCGIVGTRRFKFDVWSHDVTLANQMESDGKPGQVHISESTYELVKHLYETEEGESVPDIRKHKVLIEDYNTETQQYQVRHVREEDHIKTYFILGYKDGVKGQHNSETSPKLPVSEDHVAVNVENTQDANGTSPSGNKEKSSVEIDNEDTSRVDDHTTETSLLKLESSKQDRDAVDQQLITCMKKDQNLEKTLTEPPINRWTLRFKTPLYEQRFQKHYINDRRSSVDANEQATCASPRVGAFFDLIVSLVFLVLIGVSCFLAFPIRIPWIVFCVVATIVEIVTFIPKIMETVLSNTVIRHAYCGFLASLPVIAVASNFSCYTFWEVPESDMVYCAIVLVSLLHYVNFTILTSWVKSVLATLAGIVVVLLILLGVCNDSRIIDPPYNSSIPNNTFTNTTNEDVILFEGSHNLRFELLVSSILLVLLIWALNRDTEISYRMSFHGDEEAQVAKRKIQAEKIQADWLLHNIIPSHVTDEVKKTNRYCANHKDVGVIFAKVVNYDEFYDESFEGGREYLRVLNEMFADFEDLFDDERYKDVEKIKTIGSCLMAASGLNPARQNNKDPNAHLYALADFSVEILQKMDDFNAEIFNFDFEMAIGLNFGDVTSGVIGTTKLLYDIWGDTVNVSSRMYSTGESGSIQVTELTANKLQEKFEFKYRDRVMVKGKGEMNTYLLVEKRPGATWE